MARVSSTAASTLGTGVSNPTIQNLPIVAATELTVNIPAGSRRFKVQHRDLEGLEIRTAPGALEYYTIECGNDYQEVDLSPTTTYTVYVTCDVSGTLEVISWA